MKQREKAIPKTGGAKLRIPESPGLVIELSSVTNKPDEVKKWEAERAKSPADPLPGSNRSDLAIGLFEEMTRFRKLRTTPNEGR